MTDEIAAITQAMAVALLVERIGAVVQRVVVGAGRGPRRGTEEWNRLQVVLAFVVGLLICGLYDYDAISALLGKPASVPFAGYVMTSIIVAGGSAGIKKITDALSALAAAVKLEAVARHRRAASLIEQESQ